ncbi:MAG: hypothetical protein AAFY60_02265 [Myxococcota bacterium]
MKRVGSVGRGVAYGTLLALAAAWPMALAITSIVDEQWSTSVFFALRHVHQALLWCLGGIPAAWLLKRAHLTRGGAMAMACAPILLDSITQIAFGFWPLALGSWSERALAAISATALWIAYTRLAQRLSATHFKGKG